MFQHCLHMFPFDTILYKQYRVATNTLPNKYLTPDNIGPFPGAWYKFEDDLGQPLQMVASDCVQMNRCGTTAPAFIKATEHPTVGKFILLNYLQQWERTRNPHRVWMQHGALHTGLKHSKLTAGLRHSCSRLSAVNLLGLSLLCGYVQNMFQTWVQLQESYAS